VIARFDVYEMKNDRRLVLDCQSNLLSHFKSRFVVPLLRSDCAPRALPRLTPQFEVDGQSLIMATHLALTISVSAIKRVAASLSDYDTTIIEAIDTLTTDAYRPLTPPDIYPSYHETA
jgi:toxin CcdB